MMVGLLKSGKLKFAENESIVVKFDFDGNQVLTSKQGMPVKDVVKTIQRQHTLCKTETDGRWRWW
jgi:hypothetical protein